MVGLTAWPDAASAGNIRQRPVAVQQEADPAIISGIGTTEAERMFGAAPGASYRAFMSAGIDEKTRDFYKQLHWDHGITGSDPWV